MSSSKIDSSPVKIFLPQGTIPITVLDLDHWLHYGLRICINYSSQLAATLVLLVVLLLLTRPEKRTSPIFILNAISLATNTIRNILATLYFTSRFYGVYAYFTLDYSRVPSHQFSNAVAAAVITAIELICVEASLVLQVRAVTVTMRERNRLALLILSVAVALVAIGFRFGLMVENCKTIVVAAPFTKEWLAASALYIETASICFFSAVFVCKLGIAIHQRRKLGIKQFGPMQMIFIMGCQTLFIPAIFSILQFFTPVPELGTQVLTLTAIFMPLSSMWAATAANGNTTSTGESQNALLGKGISNYSSTTATSNSMEKKGRRSSFAYGGTSTSYADSPKTDAISIKDDA